MFAAHELFSGRVMAAEERLLLRTRLPGDGGGGRAGDFGGRMRVFSICGLGTFVVGFMEKCICSESV